MAVFTVNRTLGDDTNATAFHVDTSLWSGTQNTARTVFSNTEELEVEGRNITLSARDCVVLTSRFGRHTRGVLSPPENGTFNFTNVSIDLNRTGGAASIGGSGAQSYNWTDVKILYADSAYGFFGNFDRRAADGVTFFPSYAFNNVQFEGAASNTTDEAYVSLLTSTIDSSSVFNNVSFWNNQTGANAKGGILQSSAGIIYNNTIVGPFGTNINSVDDLVRLFVRFTNQQQAAINTSVISRHNSAGLANNFDFRALGIVNTTDKFWVLDIDEGAHMVFNNWLPGRPASVGTTIDDETVAGFAFGSLFTTANGVLNIGGTFGGRAQVFIATNPDTAVRNPQGTILLDGDHRFTFRSSDLITTNNAGILIPTTGNALSSGTSWDTGATWGTTASPIVDNHLDFLTSTDTNINASSAPAGIWFRNQQYLVTNETQVASSLIGYTSFNENILSLATDKSYRKYSWLQQPDNTTWGKQVTVSVPPENATDAQVEAARAGGYDLYNGTEWETSTDVSDTEDTIITSLGTDYDTVTEASTQLNTTGGVTSGSTAIAAIKLNHYNNINPGTTNTRDVLPYSISGTNISLGSNTLILSNSATGITRTGSQYTLPVSDLETTDVVDGLTSTSDITISGDALSSTSSTKADITAGTILLNTSPDIANANIISTSGDIGATATANRVATAVSSILTSSDNIFINDITNSTLTATDDINVYGDIVRSGVGTTNTVLSATDIIFDNSSDDVTGIAPVNGAPGTVLLSASNTISNISSTDFVRIAPSSGSSLTIDYASNETIDNTVITGGVTTADINSGTISNSAITTSTSISNIGTSSSNTFNSPIVTLSDTSTDDIFNGITTLNLNGATVTNSSLSSTTGTVISTSGVNLVNVDFATNNVTNDITGINIVTNSNLTAGGNISFETTNDTGSIILNSALADTIINSSGSISNLNSISGFFNSSTGAAKNTSITATDNINSTSTGGSIINATINSEDIGDTNPFDDITHSVINASDSFTSGGDILRTSALGGNATTITADTINLQDSATSKVEATAGRIILTSSNAINNTNILTSTDVVDSIGDTLNITFRTTGANKEISDTKIGTTTTRVDAINFGSATSTTDITNDSEIFASGRIQNTGSITDSSLDTTDTVNGITFGTSSSSINNSKLKAPIMNLDNTNISNSSVIETISDGDITNVSITTNSEISANGSGDIILGAFGNIQTGSNLSAFDIDLNEKNITGSIINARNNITNAADMTDSDIDATNEILFNTTDINTISNSTIDAKDATFNDTNISNNSTVTIINDITDTKDITNSTVISTTGDIDNNTGIISNSTITATAGNLSDVNQITNGSNISVVNLLTDQILSSASITATGDIGLSTNRVSTINSSDNTSGQTTISATGTDSTIFSTNITNSFISTSGTDSNINIDGNIIGNSSLPSGIVTINSSNDVTFIQSATPADPATTITGNNINNVNITATNDIINTGSLNRVNLTANDITFDSRSTTTNATINADIIDLNNATINNSTTITSSTALTTPVTDSIIDLNSVTGATLTAANSNIVFGSEATRSLDDSTTSSLEIDLNATPTTNTSITTTNDISNTDDMTGGNISTRDMISQTSGGIINNTTFDKIRNLTSNDTILRGITANSSNVTGNFGTSANNIATIDQGSSIDTSGNIFVNDSINSQLNATDINVFGDVTGNSPVPSLTSSLIATDEVILSSDTTIINSSIAGVTVDVNEGIISNDSTITSSATTGDGITDLNEVTNASLITNNANIVFSSNANRKVEGSTITSETLDLNETPVSNNSALTITEDISNTLNINDSTITARNIKTNDSTTTTSISNTSIDVSGSIGENTDDTRIKNITNNSNIKAESDVFIVNTSDSQIETDGAIVSDINISGDISRTTADSSDITIIKSNNDIIFNSSIKDITATAGVIQLEAGGTISQLGNIDGVNIINTSTINFNTATEATINNSTLGTTASPISLINFNSASVNDSATTINATSITNASVFDNATINTSIINFTDADVDNSIKNNASINISSSTGIDLESTPITSGATVTTTSITGDITGVGVVNAASLISANDITLGASSEIQTGSTLTGTDIDLNDRPVTGSTITASNLTGNSIISNSDINVTNDLGTASEDILSIINNSDVDVDNDLYINDITNSTIDGNTSNSTITISGDIKRDTSSINTNITSQGDITFKTASQELLGINPFATVNISAETAINNLPTLRYINISEQTSGNMSVDFLSGGSVQESTINANEININEATIEYGTNIIAGETTGNAITNINIVDGFNGTTFIPARLTALSANITFSSNANRVVRGGIITSKTLDLNATPVSNNSTLIVTEDISNADDINDSTISTRDMISQTDGGIITDTTFSKIRNLTSNNTVLSGVTATTSDITGDFGTTTDRIAEIKSGSNITTKGIIAIVDMSDSTISTIDPDDANTFDIDITGDITRTGLDTATLTSLTSENNIVFSDSTIQNVTGFGSVVQGRIQLSAANEIKNVGNITQTNIVDPTGNTLDVDFNATTVSKISSSDIGSTGTRVNNIDLNDASVEDNSKLFASGTITDLGDVKTNSTVDSSTSVTFKDDTNEISGSSEVIAPTIELSDTTTVTGNSTVKSTNGNITGVENATNANFIANKTSATTANVVSIREISQVNITADDNVIWEVEDTIGDNKSTRSTINASSINFNLADITGGTYTASGTSGVTGLDNINIFSGSGVNEPVQISATDSAGSIVFTGPGNIIGNQQFEVLVNLRAEGTTGSITGLSTANSGRGNDVKFTDIRTPTLSNIGIVEDGSLIQTSSSASIFRLDNSNLNAGSGTVSIGESIQNNATIQNASTVSVTSNATNESLITNTTTTNIGNDISQSDIKETETININTNGSSIGTITSAELITNHLTNSSDTTIDGSTNKVNVVLNTILEADTITNIENISTSTFKAETFTATNATSISGIGLFESDGSTRQPVDIDFSGNVSNATLDFERTTFNTQDKLALLTNDDINIVGNVTNSSTLVADTITVSGNVTTSSTLKAPTSVTLNGEINSSTIEATSLSGATGVVNANSTITNSEITATTLNATDIISGSDTIIDVTTLQSITSDIINVNNINKITATTIGSSSTTGLNTVTSAEIETTTAFIDTLISSTVNEIAGSTSVLNLNGDVTNSNINIDTITGVQDVFNSTIIAPTIMTVNGTVNNSNINFNPNTNIRTTTGSVNITGDISNTTSDGNIITIVGDVSGTSDIDSTTTVTITGNVAGTATIDATTNIDITGDVFNTSKVTANNILNISGIVKNTSLPSNSSYNVGSFGNMLITRGVNNASVIKQLSDEFTYTFTAGASLTAGNKTVQGITINVTDTSSSGVATAFATAYNNLSSAGTATATSTSVIVTNTEASNLSITTTAGIFDGGNITSTVANTHSNKITIQGSLKGTATGVIVNGNILDINKNSILNSNINVDSDTMGKATILNIKEAVGTEEPQSNIARALTVNTTVSGDGLNNIFTILNTTINSDDILTGNVIPSGTTNSITLSSDEFEFIDDTTVKYIGSTHTFSTNDTLTLVSTTTPETAAGRGGFITKLKGRVITDSTELLIASMVVTTAVTPTSPAFKITADFDILEGSTYELFKKETTDSEFIAVSDAYTIIRASDDTKAIDIQIAGNYPVDTTFRVDITAPKKVVNLYFNDVDWSELFIQNNRIINTQTLSNVSIINGLNATSSGTFVDIDLLTGNESSTDDVFTTNDEISAVVERPSTGEFFRIDSKASVITAGSKVISFTLAQAELPSSFNQFESGDIIRWTDQIVRLWSRGNSITRDVKSPPNYHPNIRIQAVATFRLDGAPTPEQVSGGAVNPYLSPVFNSATAYNLYDRVSDNLNRNWRATKVLSSAFSQPGVKFTTDLTPGTSIASGITFSGNPTTSTNFNLVQGDQSPSTGIFINDTDIWTVSIDGSSRMFSTEVLPTVRQNTPVEIPEISASPGVPNRVFNLQSVDNDTVTGLVFKSLLVVSGFGNDLDGTYQTTATRPNFSSEIFNPNFITAGTGNTTTEAIVSNSAVYEKIESGVGQGVYIWNRQDNNDTNAGGWHISGVDLSTTSDWASFVPIVGIVQNPEPPSRTGTWTLYDNTSAENQTASNTSTPSGISVTSGSSAGFTTLTASQITRINNFFVKVNDSTTTFDINVPSFTTPIVGFTSLADAIPSSVTSSDISLSFTNSGETTTLFTGNILITGPVGVSLSGGNLSSINVGATLVFTISGYTSGPDITEFAPDDNISFSLIKNATEDFTFDPNTNQFIYKGGADEDPLLISAASTGKIEFIEGSWELSPNIIFTAYDFNPNATDGLNNNKQQSIVFNSVTRQPRELAFNTTGTNLSISSSDTTFDNVLIVATGVGFQDYRQSFNVSEVDQSLINARLTDENAAEEISLVVQGYQSTIPLNLNSGAILSARIQVGSFIDNETDIDKSFVPNVYDTDDQEIAIGISGTSAGIPSTGQMNRLIIEAVKNTKVYNNLVADIGRPTIFEGSPTDIIFSQGPQNPVALHPAYTSFVSTERTSQSIGHIVSSENNAASYDQNIKYHPGQLVRNSGRIYKALTTSTGSKVTATVERPEPTISVDPVSGLIESQRTELAWDPIAQTKTRDEQIFTLNFLAGLTNDIPDADLNDANITTESSKYINQVSYPVLVLPLTEFDPFAVESTVQSVLTSYRTTGVASVSDVLLSENKLDQILNEINIEQTVFEIAVGDVEANNSSGNPRLFSIPSRPGDIFTAEFRYFSGGTPQTPIEVPSTELRRLDTALPTTNPGVLVFKPEVVNSSVQYIGATISSDINQQSNTAVWVITRHRPLSSVVNSNEENLGRVLTQITAETIRTYTIDLTSPRGNTSDAANTFSISQYNVFNPDHSTPLGDSVTLRETSDITSPVIDVATYTLNAQENTITFTSIPQSGGIDLTEAHLHIFNNVNLSRIIRSIDVESLELLTSNIDDLERRIKSVIFPLY